MIQICYYSYYYLQVGSTSTKPAG